MRPSTGLALALGLALSGCAGNGSGGTPSTAAVQPPMTTSAVPPPIMTTSALEALPRAVTRAPDARLAVLHAPQAPTAQKIGGERPLSSAGSDDLELAGTLIASNGKYTAVAALQTAYLGTAFGLSYPTGASGLQELLAPVTSAPGGSCLSAATGAANFGDGSGTHTYYLVFNNCKGGTPNSLADLIVAMPIDAGFVAKYVALDGAGAPVYSTVVGTPDARPSAGSRWYALLYNRQSNGYEIIASAVGSTGFSYGFSAYESQYQPGPCPRGLPPIVAENIELFDPATSSFDPATPAVSGNATSAIAPGFFGSAKCFQADSTGPATDAFTMIEANDHWAVTATAR